MSKQTIFLALASFIIGVGVVFLYKSLHSGNTNNSGVSTTPQKQACNQFTTTEDCNPISLATSTWKTFENTKYGYAISYPQEGYITSADDYGSPEYMLFSIPGKTDLGGVDANLYPNYPPSEVPSKDLDLKLYTTEIRNLQINDPSIYVKDRKIGETKEIVIDGRKAYQFSLTKGFTTAPPSEGYAIPDNRIYLYTITENQSGQKIIIYYNAENPIAETMYQTFRFK